MYKPCSGIERFGGVKKRGKKAPDWKDFLFWKETQEMRVEKIKNKDNSKINILEQQPFFSSIEKGKNSPGDLRANKFT